ANKAAQARSASNVQNGLVSPYLSALASSRQTLRQLLGVERVKPDKGSCLVGCGSAFATPAAQAEGVLQFALVQIDLVFDRGDTLLVVGKLASFFEFLGQFDQALLILISCLGVEGLAAVLTQRGANRQLG